jgi:hypothetical protein
VVSTPTSEVTNISSRLSKTSSSTLDFPATALVSFEKKDVLVFSKPLSRTTFSCSVITDSFFF